MAGLEVLGDNFNQQYKEAISKRQYRKPVVPDAMKAEIIGKVKAEMKPESAIVDFEVKGWRKPWSIALTETPGDLSRFTKYIQSTGNYLVSMSWKGEWLSAFMSKADLDKLKPSTADQPNHYLLVGLLKEGEYKGRQQWSMSVYAILTMDEVAETGGDEQ